LFRKVIDYREKIKRIAEKIGMRAEIDWIELDHALGTRVKKIYIYNGMKIVGTLPFNRVLVDDLKRHMPVVDLTGGRPYPEEYEKMPRKAVIMGRFNLIDLNI